MNGLDPNIVTIVRWTRAAIVLGVLLVVLVLADLVSRREERSAAATAHQMLEAGSEITRNDLDTEQTRLLIGRFLSQRVEAGKPVTLAATSKFRLPPGTTNTLAVLITVPVPGPNGPMKLRDREPVEIVRDGQALTSGTILDFGCGATDCTVLVGLAAAKPNIDSISLKGAGLRPLLPPPIPGGEVAH
jgi:hypothetical protein